MNFEDYINLRVGDKIVMSNPDETSLEFGVLKGHVGKVITSPQVGGTFRVHNPKWSGGWIPVKGNECQLVVKRVK